MRIEWLYPWIPHNEYLIWASVCREWRDFLQERMEHTTDITAMTASKSLIAWARNTTDLTADRLILHTLYHNDIELIKEFMPFDSNITCTFEFGDRLFIEAAKYADISILELLHETFPIRDPESAVEALRYNKTRNFYFLCDRLPCEEKTVIWFEDISIAAAGTGNLPVLMNLKCEQYCHPQVIEEACRNNHTDVAQWAFPHINDYWCLQSAVDHGNLYILNWMYLKVRQYINLFCISVRNAIVMEHMDILRWFVSKRYEFDSHQYAYVQSIKTARFLVEQGILPTEEFALEMAVKNNFELLQFAHENGVPINADIIRAVNINASLVGLQWLYSMDFLPTEELYINGSIETLDWAFGVGLPFPKNGFLCCGHPKVWEWLYSKGCPWEGHDLYWIACQYSHMLVWAIDHGCPLYEKAFEAAISSNKINSLKILSEYMKLPDYLLDYANEQESSDEIIEWLEEKYQKKLIVKKNPVIRIRCHNGEWKEIPRQ